MSEPHIPAPSRPVWPVAGLILLLALSGLLVLPRLGVHLDEAYYWYWAKHPDLAYLDHPPLVAWLIALSTAVGGDSPLFLRLGGWLLTWAGFGLAFAAARRWFPGADRGLAWEYLLLLNLTVIFPGAGIVQTPDTPLFACWMGALYFTAGVVREGRARDWYGLGLCLGLGMLGKYTMVLLVPGILLLLLLAPSQRPWLARKEPWLAALLALAVFSPVLIWNAGNGWLSFGFQLHQGLTPDGDPLADKLLDYLAGQAAIVSPLLLPLVLLCGGYGTWLAWRRRQLAFGALALLTWPPLLFFAWTTARGALAEANWPAPAYLAGLLLAWAVFRHHCGAGRGVRVLVYAALGLTLVLGLALRLHLVWPWLPLPPERDRLHEFQGWDRLGAAVEQVIARHPGASGWFLAGDRGTLVAEAVYYTGNRYVGLDFARPERYLFLTDPNRTLAGHNAVLLGWDDPGTLAGFRRYFARVEPLDPYLHRYRGVPIPKQSTRLYLGEGFLGNWEAFDRLRERRFPGPGIVR
jgi:4-amino-4-deoxy-L-arabinose transferase-like glycosyltransferase